MNTHISSDEIKNVLKTNHLFNIVLMSKPHIIKIEEDGLDLFYFSFHFLFYFLFIFWFFYF